MDDQAPQENPPKDFNKNDLTQLQGFSFGTQWTQDKSAAREPRRDERPRRAGSPERRDDRGAPPAADRRDRRTFRKPGGDSPAEGGAPAPAESGTDPRPPRRDYPGGGEARGPRREPGKFRGGPRRDGPGGERFPSRGGPHERGPYDSPYFTVTFHPEDVSFATLTRTIRASCRTFELFDIARTVIGKPDRFVVVLQRKPAGEDAPPTGEAAKPAPLALAVPDSVPFENEEAAIAHVLSKHLGAFFDTAEVEIDPPKGNFQVLNRCGVTGVLLGPPNYHRYSQIVQQHHAAKLVNMPFESFRAKIETVRDAEVINQWIEKMKKATRYTWKFSGNPSVAKAMADKPAVAEAMAGRAESAPTPAVAEVMGDNPAVPAPASSAEAAPAAAPSSAERDSTPPSRPAGDPELAAPAPIPATESAPATLTFDSREEARSHLLTQARDKVLRVVEHVRFHGKIIDLIPPGEIRRAVEGTLERQHRFPLDTANALRGRLRREGFTIFKKGSKGISYVCAVKRKFRVLGQVFAETIDNLISFIVAHPMIRASELPVKFLKLGPPFSIKATEGAPAALAASENATSSAHPSGDAEIAAPAPTPAKPEPMLTTEQRTLLGRMQGDLAWLVHEGYVTEFIDGRLFAAPAMVEARKKEIESSENDPENFPDAPVSAPPFVAAPAATGAISEDVASSSRPSGDPEVAPPVSTPVSGPASAPAIGGDAPPSQG
ncbi:MAG: hypothetical protein EXS39_04195 [Opitutaceae bacterium]|nr:hypothetical protein [Opitutaceae bacterium]